mgnify:CR=1 FL=1
MFGEVEKGWVPPHDVWERFELLGKPRFTSDGEVLLSPAISIAFHLIDHWYHGLTGAHLAPGPALASR